MSSSSSQMRAAKLDRPPHNSSSSTTASASGYSQSGTPQNPHMRPPSSSSSSRDNPQFSSSKGRSHSMGAPSTNTQHQSLKDRHMSNSGNNGSLSQPHMKHDSKPTKIHPTTIGVNQNQIDPSRKPYSSSGSSSSSGNKPPQNYNQLPKHRSVPPPSGGMPKAQQQTNQTKPPPPPTTPQMPPSQFKLLDDSVITDTSLKASPTHPQQTSKPSSIFSPDWKDTSSTSVIPPLTTMSSSQPTQQPPQQQQIRNSQSNRNNNNSQHSHAYKQQHDKKSISQPPPLVGILGNDLDFFKQEKISSEPPQQLLATKDLNRETHMKPSHQSQAPGTMIESKTSSMKRPPPENEDNLVREMKLRRLEARMEADMMPPDLQAIKIEDNIKPQQLPELTKREVDKWQQMHAVKRPDDRQSSDDLMIKRETGGDKWSKRMRDYQGQQILTGIDVRAAYNDTQSNLQQQYQQSLQPPPQLLQQQQPNMTMSQSTTVPIPTTLGNAIPPVNDSKSVKLLSTVNGIETNPDLISSLLKESLCSTDSKFGSSLAPSHTTILPITDIPGPLLSDSIIDFPGNLLADKIVLPPVLSTAENSESSHHHRKSEKKKKKEKHKHKERSKDKEERKKHKKDKDRHRDRSREREHHGSHHAENSMKITIPKNKISLPLNQEHSTTPTGIKLKIPKDRIKTPAPVAASAGSGGPGGDLKIKISLKDTNSNK